MCPLTNCSASGRQSYRLVSRCRLKAILFFAVSFLPTFSGAQEVYNEWTMLGPHYEYPIAIHDSWIHPSRSQEMIASNKYWYVSSRSLNGGSSWSEIGTFDSLVSDPSNAEHVLATAYYYYLYESWDGGATWSVLSYAPFYAFALAFHPSNSQIVYAGSYYGFYVSLNGGKTWSPKNQGLPSGYPYVTALAVEPTDGNVIYLGTAYYGMYKSTNGGETWSAINAGVPKSHGGPFSYYSYGATDEILDDPFQSSVVYALRSGEWILKSENAGATWKQIKGGGLPGSSWVRAIALSRSVPGRLYAGFEQGGLYRSENGGGAWSKLDSSPALTVVEAASDPKTILVGTTGGTSVSKDGGSTWLKTPITVKEPVYASGFGFDPNYSGRVYATSSYGLFRTDDFGQKWTLVTSKLEEGLVTVDPADSNVIYVGNNWTLSGLYKSTNGGATFSYLGLSEGRFTGIWIPRVAGDLFVGTLDRLLRSSNGGSTWQTVSTEIRSATELAVDSKNLLRLYIASGTGLWTSIDGGQTWSLLKSGDVSGVAIDINNSAHLWIVHPYVGLYHSLNGGVSWVPVPASTSYVHGPVIADRADPQRLTVGYGSGGFQMTRDGGKTWTPYTTYHSGKLAEDPTRPRRFIASHYCVPLAYFSFGPQPIAYLSANVTSGVAPLTVNFTVGGTEANGSLLVGGQYRLDVDGDGLFDWTGSSGGTVSHAFGKAGTYRVLLRVFNASGNFDDATVITSVSAGVNVPPVAGLTVTPSVATVPFTATLYGTGSDPYGAIVLFEYDFDGDGVWDWSSTTTGVTTVPIIKGGSWQVRFRVTDDTGLTDTVSASLVGNAPPMVEAHALPAVAEERDLVELGGHAEAVGNGTIVLHEWDVDGDGTFDWSSSTSGILEHRYEVSGSYVAGYRATDSNGLFASHPATVKILECSCLKVWISRPRDSAKIAGNQVSLRANTAPGEQTASVQFQYKLLQSDTWIDLGTPVLPQPLSFPAVWDVSAFSVNTEVHLRAVAKGLDEKLYDSLAIQVTVNASDPDIRERDEASGRYVDTEKVSSAEDHRALLWDGTDVVVPYGAVSSETVLQITEVAGSSVPAIEGYQPVGVFRDVSLQAGTQFPVALEISLPYKDQDGDGVEDTLGIAVDKLRLLAFNASLGKWEVLDGVGAVAQERVVAATTTHLSLFGLFANTSSGGTGGDSGTGGGAGGGGGGVGGGGEGGGAGGGGGGGGCFLRSGLVAVHVSCKPTLPALLVTFLVIVLGLAAMAAKTTRG